MRTQIGGQFRSMKSLLLKGNWLGHPLHPVLAHLPWRCGRAHSSWICFHNVRSVATPWSDYHFTQSFLAWRPRSWRGRLDLSIGVESRRKSQRGKSACITSRQSHRTLLFAVNLALRWQTFRDASEVDRIPLLLSAVGTLILIASAYLGGRMVYEYGISVARMSKKKWRKLAAAGGANLPPE
jgi:hypothetical protein